MSGPLLDDELNSWLSAKDCHRLGAVFCHFTEKFESLAGWTGVMPATDESARILAQFAGGLIGENLDVGGLDQLVGFVGNVKIDGRTTGFVSMKNAKWWSIHVERDEILAAYIRVAELMDIRNIRAGY